jgi:hypothetical protein
VNLGQTLPAEVISALGMQAISSSLDHIAANHLEATVADLQRHGHGATAEHLSTALTSSALLIKQSGSTLTSTPPETRSGHTGGQCSLQQVTQHATELVDVCQHKRHHSSGWDCNGWQECLIFAYMCAIFPDLNALRFTPASLPSSTCQVPDGAAVVCDRAGVTSCKGPWANGHSHEVTHTSRTDTSNTS